MRRSLDSLANHLAGEGGGFTLWVGAGVSIALTNGSTPGWSELVRDLAAEHDAADFRLTGDFPLDLERLSQLVSHGEFRRALRKRLIDPIRASLSVENGVHQALFGARASTLVSFNLEFSTSIPLTLTKCGSQFVARTFRERGPYALEITPKPGPGTVSAPVYFPHGLLDYGSIVMTKSEYERHQGSLAVTTAVHLAIGGDLVILGMSLGDQYLRSAILQNRRWLRDVYWLASSFDHLEWARVANVTLVEISHDTVWKTLAEAVLRNDKSGKMEPWLEELKSKLPGHYGELQAWSEKMKATLDEFGTRLVANAETTTEHLTMFAAHYLDLGYEVPPHVLDDPRCAL